MRKRRCTAKDREWFDKMLTPIMTRVRYPTLITDKIITVWPLWCLVVMDEKDENEGCDG